MCHVMSDELVTVGKKCKVVIESGSGSGSGGHRVSEGAGCRV